jgi:hypothetical protein
MIAIAIFCLLSAILLIAMTLHAELSQEEMANAKRKVRNSHGGSARF